ncbi:MAG: Hsp20/alpha crystallin family protein [Firmicutes bacterium]|nr:Hsp20/alpha crystallin family protein [Bacillota bacterium]
MTLMNWDPWRDIADMRNTFNRLFGEATPGTAITGHTVSGSWMMPVDISETADEFLVKAELPGMKPEEIDITVADNQVTLKGQRTEAREEKSVNYIRSERRLGSFYRSFALSAPVDDARVTATYKDGVLEVHLPKSEAVRPRQIRIQSE